MATTQQETPDTTRERRAVLYVCAERSLYTTDVAATRAEDEGRVFAVARGLTILETVTAPYGTPGPLHRQGRQRVRALARAAAIDTVITRWPAAIAPAHSSHLRHQAAGDLAEHGVQILHSWAPLAPSRQRP